MNETLFFSCWVAGFVFGPYLLSRQSGWQQLRLSFPAADEPAGLRFRVVAITLNGVRYNGVLYAVVADRGLYLDPFIPFLPLYHPPLLIPWSAFSPFEGGRWDKILGSTITTRDGTTITFATLPNLQQEIQAMIHREAASNATNA